MRCRGLPVLLSAAALQLSGNVLLRGPSETSPAGGQGGNDTAWYRYRAPGASLHPHMGDPAWSGDVVKDLVLAHDALRARVGLGALREDPELTRRAEAAVQRIAAARGCEIYHSSTDSRLSSGAFYYVGENLYKVEGMEPTGGGIADAWYAELTDYRYGLVGEACTKACAGRTNPPCQTGHFTQMMWEDTTHVGCGVAACGSQDNVYMAVCQYGPGGNLVGQKPFSDHVASALHLSTRSCSAGGHALAQAVGGPPGNVALLLGVLVLAAAVVYALRK